MKRFNQLVSEMAIRAAELGAARRLSGSSHDVSEYDYKNQRVIVKFPDSFLYQEIGDPNDETIHILSEYLTYHIYSLYSIPIPEYYDLVIRNDKIGLLTKFVPGYSASTDQLSASDFSLTFLINAFLANWDVGGGGTSKTNPNIIFDSATNKYTIIDPGGALGFRARGARKGAAFDATVGEIDTFRDGSITGLSSIFSAQETLQKSMKKFKQVPWAKIEKSLRNFSSKQISGEIMHKMENSTDAANIVKKWEYEIDTLIQILKKRHDYILKLDKYI